MRELIEEYAAVIFEIVFGTVVVGYVLSLLEKVMAL